MTVSGKLQELQVKAFPFQKGEKELRFSLLSQVRCAKKHSPLVDIHTIVLKDHQAECLDVHSKRLTAMQEPASSLSAAGAAAPELAALGVWLCSPAHSSCNAAPLAPLGPSLPSADSPGTESWL